MEIDIFSTTLYGAGSDQIEITILNEALGDGIVGIIRSEILKNDVAIIEDMQESDEYAEACFRCGENGKAPRVVMRNHIFEDLKLGTDEALMILFHELGHYYNGDDLDTDYIINDYDSDRIRYCESGEVLPMELAADAFAVRYIGGSRTMNGLAQLIKRTEKSGEEGNNLAISELSARIAAIGDVDN